MGPEKPFRDIAADVHDDPEAMAEVSVMVAAMLQGEGMGSTRPIEDVLPKVYGDPERMTRIGRMTGALRDALALAKARGNAPRIVGQDDLYLATLREYVEVLGGTLEVRAVFPDRVVALEPRRKRRPRKANPDADA